MDYENVFDQYKWKSIQGRYVTLDLVAPVLQLWNSENNLEVLGLSVQGRAIYKYKIGVGKTKILMWSQMHGNESTTTKGLIDFIHFLQSETAAAQEILATYTFCFLPLLNPDGALAYTRVNANNVDLNRDFVDLSQPESQLLMNCYRDFEPHYCYNLHDQRTIFGAGTIGKPATISFLAPAFNEARDYDAARLASVAVIVKMKNVLQTLIPGQIGRFDDSFNKNCSGDAFQSLKTPTILIEAGHFPEDYQREVTRKYVFIALLSAFVFERENVVVGDILSDYLEISQNIPNFFDFVYKNVAIDYDNSTIITNFAVQYKEVLIDNKIFFNGFIAKVGNLYNYFGHAEYDVGMLKYTDDDSNIPKLDEIAHFSIGSGVEFVNGLLKK